MHPAGSPSVGLFVNVTLYICRRNIKGIPIQPPYIIQQPLDEIEEVLMAIPSLSRSLRRRIVNDLQPLVIPVAGALDE